MKRIPIDLTKARALLVDRRVWIALAVIALLVVLRFSGFDRYLSLETLRSHHRELMAFVDGNIAIAGFVYVAIYVGTVTLSLPGALLLTLTGGFLFGPLIGALLTILSATTGATLVFLFARTVFSGSSLDRFGPQAQNLAANVRENAWSYLLVLRLVPLFPFFLVNIIPAFVGVRAHTFVLTTFLGIIPATAVYSLAGAGLGAVLEKEGELSLTTILTPEILLGLVGLAGLALAAIPLRKWILRRAASGARPGGARE
jgi:uncharacterized membrane protein YdjX (TVP38/TMEM64 family)